MDHFLDESFRLVQKLLVKNVDKCSLIVFFCPQLTNLSVYYHGGVKKLENIDIWGTEISNLSLFSQKITPVNQ